MNHATKTGGTGITTLTDTTAEKCKTCKMYDLLLEQSNIYKALIEKELNKQRGGSPG